MPKAHCRPLEADCSSRPKFKCQLCDWVQPLLVSISSSIRLRWHLSPDPRSPKQSPEALLPSQLQFLANMNSQQWPWTTTRVSTQLMFLLNLSEICKTKEIQVGKRYPVIFLQNFLTVCVPDLVELVREG